MKRKKSVDNNIDESALADENMTGQVDDEAGSDKKSDKNADKKSELQEWKEKYEEMNEKYLRLYSEFDNFRKRTQKEKLDLYKTANEDVLLAILPVLDDFERAGKSIGEATDPESMKKGVELIHHKLLNTLGQKGLKAMDSPVGEKFDLDTQEAITKVKAPSEDMIGKIIDEVEKGYFLNDKVIRFSKVVVGE